MNRARHELSKFVHLLIGLSVLFALSAEAQNVSLLSYSNTWTSLSLGGTQGGVQAGMTAFYTTPNNQLHLYYAGADLHIHQRYQQVRSGLALWVDEDLTRETGAPPLDSQALTGVTGFSQQNFQYVYYEDLNSHVHQMLYNNISWTDQDITALTNAIPGQSDGMLLAFTTTPNNQIHVYYGGLDDNLHQLFLNGSSWSEEDLTSETGGPGTFFFALPGFAMGNYQYVFYVASAHVHETFYNNISWKDVDLTAESGAPPTRDIGVETLAALTFPSTGLINAYYVASNNDVVELATSDNIHWTYLDLTALTKGPGASQYANMLAFTTGSNGRHLYYTAGASPWHVNQLFFNGTSWSNEDLSLETHSTGSGQFGGMGGFAIGNAQYVFYSNSN